jgi:PAS domain S-box-containing protein
MSADGGWRDQRSEAPDRYRILFEANPQPMWVYDLETLIFLEVNDAAVSHYGYTRDEFLAMTIKDIRPQEAVPAFLENLNRIGTMDSGGVWPHRRKDGTLLDVEIWGHVITFEGRGARLVLLTDVTERARARQELVAAEARTSAVIEASVDCIITIDERGRVIEFNPAAERTFGYSRHEAIGQVLADLIIPESHREAHTRGLVDVVATGHGPILGKRLDLTALRKDGSEFPVELTVTRIPMPNQVAFTGFVRDITERKGAENAMETIVAELNRVGEERQRLISQILTAQEEERKRIASDIHDESIQKMAATAMRLDMVAMDHPELRSEERFVSAQRSIALSIDTLRHLMFELHPYVLDQDGLVAALRLHLDEEAKIEGAASYQLNGDFATDPSRQVRVILYRLVQEALTNVRKHARASHVAVRLAERDGGYDVVITDDGVGFDATSRVESPAGHLGLTSMRERAEMGGGWLKIDSRHGEGTSVHLWLPRGPEEEA